MSNALFKLGRRLHNRVKTLTLAGMEKQTEDAAKEPVKTPEPQKLPKEIGGPKGPEPTRYGDWEKNGRCSDF